MTFHYDGPFTIATGTRGKTYRVLMASGGGAHYYLMPWRADGSKPYYKGFYVKATDPVYPEIEAAERARPRPEMRMVDRSRQEAKFA